MSQTCNYNGLALSEVHLDALREISNIGMGHAATALNQMIGRPVHLSIPEVKLTSLPEFVDVVGSSEELVAGVFIRVWGDIQGNILLIFPWSSVRALCQLLTGRAVEEDLGELELSALREIGNILVSSYLSAIERLLGKALLPSVPSVAVDMAGAIMETALVQMGQDVDAALVIKAAFTGIEDIHGHFFLVPDPASLRAILQAAKVLAEET